MVDMSFSCRSGKRMSGPTREIVKWANEDGFSMTEYWLRRLVKTGEVPARFAGNKAIIFYPNIVELLGAALSMAYSLKIGLWTAFWDSMKQAFTSTWDYFAGYINKAGGNIVEGLLPHPSAVPQYLRPSLQHPQKSSLKWASPPTPYAAFKDAIARYNNSKPNSEQLPGIPFHGLRHTSATLMIAMKQDVPTVSSRLGHAQVSTTMNIYAHALKELDHKASDALETILTKKA